MTSPAVCAGPTSSSDNGRSPTNRSRRPSNVRVGNASGTSSKENGAKIRARNSPVGPRVGAARIMAASVSGGRSAISSAQRAEEMICDPSMRALP